MPVVIANAVALGSLIELAPFQKATRRGRDAQSPSLVRKVGGEHVVLIALVAASGILRRLRAAFCVPSGSREVRCVPSMQSASFESNLTDSDSKLGHSQERLRDQNGRWIGPAPPLGLSESVGIVWSRCNAREQA